MVCRDNPAISEQQASSAAPIRHGGIVTTSVAKGMDVRFIYGSFSGSSLKSYKTASTDELKTN